MTKNARKMPLVTKVGDELAKAVELRKALEDHGDPKLILDMIEGETDLNEAICALHQQMLENDTQIAGIDATTQALGTRKSRLEKSNDSLRGIILMALERAELPGVKYPLATISIRETPPQLMISDEDLIPADYWKSSDPTLDRAALKTALSAGKEIPGATMSSGGVGLSIRIK